MDLPTEILWVIVDALDPLDQVCFVRALQWYDVYWKKVTRFTTSDLCTYLLDYQHDHVHMTLLIQRWYWCVGINCANGLWDYLALSDTPPFVLDVWTIIDPASHLHKSLYLPMVARDGCLSTFKWFLDSVPLQHTYGTLVVIALKGGQHHHAAYILDRYNADEDPSLRDHDKFLIAALDSCDHDTICWVLDTFYKGKLDSQYLRHIDFDVMPLETFDVLLRHVNKDEMAWWLCDTIRSAGRADIFIELYDRFDATFRRDALQNALSSFVADYKSVQWLIRNNFCIDDIIFQDFDAMKLYKDTFGDDAPMHRLLPTMFLRPDQVEEDKKWLPWLRTVGMEDLVLEALAYTSDVSVLEAAKAAGYPLQQLHGVEWTPRSLAVYTFWEGEGHPLTGIDVANVLYLPDALPYIRYLAHKKRLPELLPEHFRQAIAADNVPLMHWMDGYQHFPPDKAYILTTWIQNARSYEARAESLLWLLTYRNDPIPTGLLSSGPFVCIVRICRAAYRHLQLQETTAILEIIRGVFAHGTFDVLRWYYTMLAEKGQAYLVHDAYKMHLKHHGRPTGQMIHFMHDKLTDPFDVHTQFHAMFAECRQKAMAYAQMHH